MIFLAVLTPTGADAAVWRSAPPQNRMPPQRVCVGVKMNPEYSLYREQFKEHKCVWCKTHHIEEPSSMCGSCEGVLEGTRPEGEFGTPNSGNRRTQRLISFGVSLLYLSRVIYEGGEAP